MTEDRVWSAETERVRSTDPLGPVWRAVVVPEAQDNTEGPSSALVARLESVGVDVVSPRRSTASLEAAIDVVCVVDPRERLAGRRLAFELDAPLLELPRVPDRIQLIGALERRRVRREPALAYEMSHARGFAVDRIDVEAASGIHVDFRGPGLDRNVHRADRLAVQPAASGPSRTRSDFKMRAVLVAEAPALLEGAQRVQIQAHSSAGVFATVDGEWVLGNSDTVVVSVHTRAQLVCC